MALALLEEFGNQPMGGKASRAIRQLGLSQLAERLEALPKPETTPDPPDTAAPVEPVPPAEPGPLDEPSIIVPDGKALSPNQVWQAVIGQLQLEIPKSTFDTWVRGSALLAHEDDAFEVSVASVYAKDWLENRLLSTVKRILTGIVGHEVEVRFAVNPK